MVDPQYAMCREIKAITSKRKKTDEDLARIEMLEWYGGIYTMQNGKGQIVSQPSSKVRKCLIETAKISKLGKNVERAITMTSLDIPVVYDGPTELDDLFADQEYTSRLSVRVGSARVMRVRPQFKTWALDAPIMFVDDAGLNQDEFERIVKLAGVVTGIGDARAIGYGRFEGEVEWQS
jgi:hypothetical protein